LMPLLTQLVPGGIDSQSILPGAPTACGASRESRPPINTARHRALGSPARMHRFQTASCGALRSRVLNEKRPTRSLRRWGVGKIPLGVRAQSTIPTPPALLCLTALVCLAEAGRCDVGPADPAGRGCPGWAPLASEPPCRRPRRTLCLSLCPVDRHAMGRFGSRWSTVRPRPVPDADMRPRGPRAPCRAPSSRPTSE